MNSKRIWMTWEVQRRNRSISCEVNAKLYEIDSRSNKIIRYVILILKTLCIYIKDRPMFIFAQNPSIVLSFITVIYGKITNKYIIIDAHNAGVFPFEGKYGILNRVNEYIIKKSNMVIVTNENLSKHIMVKKGYPFVLPDPIPKIANKRNVINLKGEKNIFFICTYADDEPYMEVIDAAKLIPNNIYIYISGKISKNMKDNNIIVPNNVVLTGYLSEDDFVGMLHSADIIMDLTTRDNCLVCGAYEGIALGKPLILSDTEATRNYFSKGVIYTKNNSLRISESIINALQKIDLLKEQIAFLKISLEMEWRKKLKEMENILGSFPL